MARQRNYKAEYQRRLSRGLERGVTRQAARGHAVTPEHPERVRRQPRRFERYIARRNQERMAQGKPQLVFEPEGPIAPRTVRGEVDTLEEAERRVQGIPDNYRRIYVTDRGTFIFEIDRRESRRGRRAA